MPRRPIASPSKSNSMSTTCFRPTTQPSWPGSIATICGARCSTTHPSAIRYGFRRSRGTRRARACRGGPENRLHVDRPAESRRIDHALHARSAGPSDLEANVADSRTSAPFNGARSGSTSRPGTRDLAVLRDASRFPDGLLDLLPCGFLLCHVTSLQPAERPLPVTVPRSAFSIFHGVWMQAGERRRSSPQSRRS